MNPNRLDFWLLDSVVLFSYPMSWMVGPNIAEVLNCEGHRASDDEVADSFARLFAQGLIEAELPCANWGNGERVRLKSRAEVLDALAQRSNRPMECTSYDLTSDGGRAWESIARPDWGRFVEEEREDDAIMFRAASEEQADKYLAYQRDCWIQTHGAVERTRLRPWDATYWKELPEGFEVRVRATNRTDIVANPHRSEFFSYGPWWYTRPT